MHQVRFYVAACLSLSIGVAIGACSISPPEPSEGANVDTRPTKGKLSVRSDAGTKLAARPGDAGRSDASAVHPMAALPSDCKSVATTPQLCLECCMKNNPGGGAGDATYDRCMKDAGSPTTCMPVADAACAADPKCAALSACVKDACPKK